MIEHRWKQWHCLNTGAVVGYLVRVHHADDADYDQTTTVVLTESSDGRTRRVVIQPIGERSTLSIAERALGRPLILQSAR